MDCHSLFTLKYSSSEKYLEHRKLFNADCELILQEPSLTTLCETRGSHNGAAECLSLVICT